MQIVSRRVSVHGVQFTVKLFKVILRAFSVFVNFGNIVSKCLGWL